MSPTGGRPHKGQLRPNDWQLSPLQSQGRAQLDLDVVGVTENEDRQFGKIGAIALDPSVLYTPSGWLLSALIA